MKFQYTGCGFDKVTGELIKRPLLEIELKGKNGESTTTLALVDSGADNIIFNKQWADFMGVNLEEERPIRGVGKGVSTSQGGSFSFKVKHTAINISGRALYMDSENVNVLLGQEYFFDHFKVKFEKNNSVFELTEVEK